MRQPRRGAVGDHRQIFELKAPVGLPGKRHHDAELEVTHAGVSLQLGIEGCRQQGEGADKLKPSTPLVMVQPAERPGRLEARISSQNKFLVGGSNSQVTDAAGLVWQTRTIAEAAATVSICTMIFAVALSAVKLFQASAALTLE